ncbi:tetratricopeptide repeat protein [Polymorphobacter fuscus]|uniref:aspartyl protease family protein n=1 Tax=Sandarakinorhabdus fusca TaxID=1439888 RepID=UPI00168FD4E1|nr:tetratricopeptide repeat protein [Polymorphobacter fuscus]NJC07229.1 putative aspartyl protease/tetratricopeptide (TPR) repeat protein [Polymorphobacter fuscus]
MSLPRFLPLPLRTAVVAVAAAIIALPAAAAHAACQVTRYVELPVTMVGRRPIVTVRINGTDARFILDSGAFHSTIAKANALEHGLAVKPIAPRARMRGIGGASSIGVATAREIGIAGQTLNNIEFAVGGSDTGFAGLLGQNILGLADVEYDLPHGIVRIMKSNGCRNTGMAYWAADKPVTILDIAPMAPRQRHTMAAIKINGKKVMATFDTGAAAALLTLDAARRIGVTPDSPGVTPDRFATGLGQGRARTWRAPFDSIDIGGEIIPRPNLQIADLTLPDTDMLIGIDFFLSHRVYVDNQTHRMFITYEGGPVFGFEPKGAVDGSGAAIDLTDRSAEPTDAAGFSRRGAIRAADRKFAAAIADFDKAIALAPGDAQLFYQRAMAHLGNRQPRPGAADLDRAIALAPGDATARLARARLKLAGRDVAGALPDLQAADAALAPSADARLQLAGLFEAADSVEPVLANYTAWLDAHPEDRNRALALNGRCRARALRNRDLDAAMADCNTALRLRPDEPAFRNSRALVHLRRGDLAKALADLDAALAARPGNAWPLYTRSIVHRRLGNTAAADTDRTAALAIDKTITERAQRYKLE